MIMRRFLDLMLVLLTAQAAFAAEPPRARDLGIPFDGSPGPLNAITDVPGVTVGHATLIEDLPDGRAVRTGVTAVLPRGKESLMRPVFGAWFALNGCGEMTGTTWIEESGQLEGPVMLTNTHSVGTVHEETIAWRIRQGEADATGYVWSTPVVAETWDGPLNDINGFHVKAEHVDEALEAATTGPVVEGNVGAGTGTMCYDFKCGIGTASRVVEVFGEPYTIGVLVQANQGEHRRDELRIAGVPVGRYLPLVQSDDGPDPLREKDSSIIIVVATDAPLLPHQLKRLAKRAALGLARTGSFADNGSGDIFIAFSTADGSLGRIDGLLTHHSIPNHDELSRLFAATVRATDEAIINSMIAARDMTGNLGSSARALPHDALIEVLKEYGR
jgi:D-aminopeptidase